MNEAAHHKISAFKANQYASLFKSLNQKVDLLFEHLNNDFLITTNKVKKYTAMARTRLAEARLPEQLKLKITGAARSFDTIMVELQYHDIIRQKLEHIYTTEKWLADEFNDLFSNAVDARPRMILIMRELIELAINQLNQLKEEYLFAANKIQRLLRALWADKDVSRELHLFLFNTSENLRNVIKSIDHIIAMHRQLLAEPWTGPVASTDHRARLLADVKKLYTMESERKVFNQTFQMVEEEEIVDEIFF